MEICFFLNVMIAVKKRVFDGVSGNKMDKQHYKRTTSTSYCFYFWFFCSSLYAFFLFCILFLPIMNCEKFLWIWTQANRLNYKLRWNIAETNVLWANKRTATDSEKEIYFGSMHIFTRAHKHLLSAFVSNLLNGQVE